MVAVPLAASSSWSAVSETLWYVFQSVGEKTRFTFDATRRSSSPLSRSTATVTSATGSALSLSWKVAEPPSGTVTVSRSVRIACASSSSSVTAMSLLSQPVALQLTVAVPSTASSSWAAATRTVWYVPQSVGVNVRLAPDWTDTSVSPLARVTETATLSSGCALSLTWNVALSPSGTVRVSRSGRIICVSSSSSVTATSLLSQPVALQRIVAEPSAASSSWAAATVTVWYTFQLAAVNGSAAPF